ncbi:hypothetical protein [Arsenicibacter rosenii]|uniref:PKD domain-containing protein n=1 Tax=Arsenicibacter rosenii TaxID=1750698 RepID=A0A1S2VH50_9BACT|nr:hypothetical protein [Arsenicibacter rosenii]OIN58097.1 hypothetical protein BLX24_16350 [Arsenicibacter rosenii]
MVASVIFLCLMTHTLVAQQTTSGTNRQNLLERMKKKGLSSKFSRQQANSNLSTRNKVAFTKKCYDVKVPCGDIDGIYTLGFVDDDGTQLYFGNTEGGAIIEYQPNATEPGWYIFGDDDEKWYFNPSSSDVMPTEGWVNITNGCGEADAPASLTFAETTCAPIPAPICRQVVSECSSISGKYNEIGSFLGRPLLLKEDNSKIIVYLGIWMIFEGYDAPPSAIAESDDNLPPVSDWFVIAEGCEENAPMSVKDCSCTPEPVNALSTLVVNTLSATNCPINLRLPAYGSMAVITGPDNYVFSSVYRKPGPYLMNINGIKKPGTYTVTVSAANECGEVTSKVVTFVVNGQGCK